MSKQPSPTSPAGQDAGDAEAGTSDGAERRTGFILWLTGMSGAGKSTLSRAVREHLEPLLPVEILDGDEVRKHLSRGLGFSREDRVENVRRIGYVARLLARHRVAVIVAAISPYRDSRDEMRQLSTGTGIPFVEVYAWASLEALIRRDVKGLYKKALAGELPHFTGISDPYEPPESPEVIVRTDEETVEAGRERILETLRAWGLIARTRREH
ncbi:adenylyl-sulfate kinase [Hyalangium gracile]|uniref:adenylyl-sulfate kinase n=1 Tax=Hyalangium gracile TaxID=394092 RepID=UPI001CCDA52C|nr:adenylyl-sulfate kinase [Hyalangium gracile]